MQPAFSAEFGSSVVAVHRDIPVVADAFEDLDWARGAASLLARTIFAPSASDGTVERLVRSRLAATARTRIAAHGG
jgi:hypothetical protein